MNCHSDRISFFLNFEPDIPHLTHQNGIKPTVIGKHAAMYKTQGLRELESLYIAKLMQFAPEEPWNCACELATVWNFRCPKNAKSGHKTTKPDLSNLMKTFEDCMTKAGFFKDDALIAVETTSKQWVADMPHGIFVILRKLKNKGETK